MIMQRSVNFSLRPERSQMAATPKLRFRLMLGSVIAIGPGKADLLEAIAKTGSISAAARAMSMSYKRAWYLLDTMNRCFVEPVVVTTKGGRSQGGAALSPTGEKVLKRYRLIEAKAAAAVASDVRAFDKWLMEKPEI